MHFFSSCITLSFTIPLGCNSGISRPGKAGLAGQHAAACMEADLVTAGVVGIWQVSSELVSVDHGL